MCAGDAVAPGDVEGAASLAHRPDRDAEILHELPGGIEFHGDAADVVPGAVHRSPLADLSIHDEPGPGSGVLDPERVDPGSRRQVAKLDRLGRREMSRLVCAGAPDRVE